MPTLAEGGVHINTEIYRLIQFLKVRGHFFKFFEYLLLFRRKIVRSCWKKLKINSI